MGTVGVLCFETSLFRTDFVGDKFPFHFNIFNLCIMYSACVGSCELLKCSLNKVYFYICVVTVNPAIQDAGKSGHLFKLHIWLWS